MSKKYKPHLYMVCYPIEALVLSHYEPKGFVQRFSYGSTSYHSGKLMFAEIDINYRHPYFKLDEALESLKPHPDGTPKASKYVSNYRVLEHIDVDAVKTLYLVNADGTGYPLFPGEYKEDATDSGLHIYAEVTPLSMITLSTYNLREFGHWFTVDNEFLKVPRLLYLELALDFDVFLSSFEKNPFAPPPIEGVHPSKLRDAILDLRSRPEKHAKGLTLDMALTKQSYRSIKGGIMLMDGEKEKYFVMPPLKEIEEKDLRFYRSM